MRLARRNGPRPFFSPFQRASPDIRAAKLQLAVSPAAVHAGFPDGFIGQNCLPKG